MIIMLMGPQGSGKGTEGALLSDELKLPLVGTGNLLRNIPKNHPKYMLIKSQMEKGDLADYETTAELLKGRLTQQDCSGGYVLDGWGRVMEQFKYFVPEPNAVLYIDIPLEESVKRISGRRICEPTGELLNIYTSSPEELKKCQDHLIQRDDDKEEVVRQRQEVFETNTMPVVEMYKKQGILLEIDGVGTRQEVHARVMKALKDAAVIR